MIATVKRKTVVALLVAFIAVVCLFVTAASVSGASATNGITVVIDAGHGGADGGVTGIKTGTKESDVNLAIATRLKGFLADGGYNAVMTRSDMNAVASGVKYNKLKDMQARKEIIEKAKPDLVISVHCNSYPVASVKGAQMFYAPTSDAGAEMATKMQAYVNSALNEKARAAAKGDYYILQCTPYLSILAECGFLSNPVEEAKLVTQQYQEKVAYVLYTAIADALKGETTAN